MGLVPAVPQAVGGAEKCLELLGGIAPDRQPAAALGPGRREGRQDDEAARLQTAPEGAQIAFTSLVLGEEVEDGAIVPEPVAARRRIPEGDVADRPGDARGGGPRRTLATASAVSAMSRTVTSP